MATADTGRLTKTAMFGLDCIWREGFRYSKAGIVFLALVKAERVQGSLFLHPDDPRSKTLMVSIDMLDRRYGRGTVAYGTAGQQTAWGLRSEHRSARYMTRWGEMLSVGQEERGAASVAPNPPEEGSIMPSMPALDTYEIVQEDDDTYAVVFARTGTVAQLNGVPQLGLALDRADDVTDHLEATDRIAAARGTGRLDS